jgi:hypothetical protein
MTDYATFAAALTATGLVTDPWVDGAPRFRREPLRLESAEAARLAGAAEAIAAAHHEVALLVADEPHWLEDFFALTPVQALLWHASAPLWHGIARADVFVTDDGQALVCELNADTPSGQAEAVLLGPAAGVPRQRDPNRALERRFVALLEQFLDGAEAPVVGIVYPTEIAGDFALVRLYQRWCQRRGWQVVLGSPYNLHRAADGRAALFGTTCDIVIRHYKTDWWGERLPLWRDEAPYPDAAPLLDPLRVLIDGGCPVVNPLGAVLAQNKRTLAFLWEHQEALSPAARAAVRAHLPETWRLEALPPGLLASEQGDWVLKSDYGCEGEEVLIGALLPPQEWRRALELAIPRRWIAQRFFRARQCPAAGAGALVNHGVFLVAGQAAGLYARVSAGPTDVAAVSVPIEVMP